ncbi:glutamyl-Q tRNA(Asp) synthetase [Enterovirga rhinocerotis]|uniref:Glutamyl-Q tRNA(Asp) synthetase n=2 Tax=Enterovirga rhinocerotis TaxID=1339210 RepID=A0A4R7BSA7_9HYPH|nr:glutamyl-Q tRNA(Asp) synthetase [Enterovirga rhinocerotis]
MHGAADSAFSDMSQPTFRFAPSPNGRLHLGHAASALLNERLAREGDGRLLLRIEDIDPVRSRPDLAEAILADLAWLGLAWEEPVRRQSEHMADYEAAACRLREEGLLYPCFCSRSEIGRAAEARAEREGRPIARDPDGTPLYPGTCRGLSAEAIAARMAEGRHPAWRLAMTKALARIKGEPLTWTRFDPAGSALSGAPQDEEDGSVQPGSRPDVAGASEVAADPARWGDAVLVRRDTPTSYHLAVVVDDAIQGVTHVVRGRDLEAATDLHRLLQALLGLPSPHYHHHALILDEAGEKLAKRAGSPALADLRAAGETPASIRRRLGF